jgi:lysozyme family protein
VSAASFPRALAVVLGYEGGFVDDARDPGGATCWGVTLSALSAFRGAPCGVEDVRRLTEAEVAPLYRRDYWNAVRGDDLPVGVDLIAFDAAVNQGPGTAVRLLRQAVGAPADGAIGPATLKAVMIAPPLALIERLRLARLARYRQSAGWDTFGQGWSRRVDGVAQTASAWARPGAATGDGAKPVATVASDQAFGG